MGTGVVSLTSNERLELYMHRQRAPKAKQLHAGTGVVSLSSNERLELYMDGQRAPKAKQLHVGTGVVSLSSNERLELYMHERLLLRLMKIRTLLSLWEQMLLHTCGGLHAEATA